MGPRAGGPHAVGPCAGGPLVGPGEVFLCRRAESERIIIICIYFIFKKNFLKMLL